MNLRWLKRNLLFIAAWLLVLSSVVASAVYCISQARRSQAVTQALTDTRRQLVALQKAKPFPNRSNTVKALQQAAEIRAIASKAQSQFAPILFTNATGEDFKIYLDFTLHDLRKEAALAGLKLPGPHFAFTFARQQALVSFAPGSFPALPRAVAEVNTLCRLVFDSGCDILDLRRERLTSDDHPNAPGFTDLKSRTNTATGAVLVPYELTLACSSRELANLIEALSRSPHGFLVKALAVEPLKPVAQTMRPPARSSSRWTPAAQISKPGTSPPAATSAAAEPEDYLLRAELLIMLLRPES